MAGFLIERFGGIVPILSARKLNNGLAQVAQDCRLEGGQLRPMRAPREVEGEGTEEADVLSMYLHHRGDGEDVWLFDTAAEVSRVAMPAIDAANSRVVEARQGVVSGITYPTLRDGDDVYKLGIPAPTKMLATAVETPPVDTPTAEIEYVTYVYTYVDIFGFEGPPSPVSTAKARVRPTATNSEPVFTFTAESETTATGFLDDIRIIDPSIITENKPVRVEVVSTASGNAASSGDVDVSTTATTGLRRYDKSPTEDWSVVCTAPEGGNFGTGDLFPRWAYNSSADIRRWKLLHTGSYFKLSYGDAAVDLSDLPFSFIQTNLLVRSITAGGEDATLVTCTMPFDHKWTVGSTQAVTISGAVQTEYNGAYTATATGKRTFTYVFAGSTTPTATGTIVATISRDIQSIVWAAGKVTVTTTTAHTFASAQRITIAGCTPAAYNGTFTATVLADTGNLQGRRFTFPLAVDPGTATAVGTISRPTTFAAAAVKSPSTKVYVYIAAGHGIAVTTPVSLVVAGVGGAYDGTHLVTKINTTAAFYYIAGNAIPPDTGGTLNGIAIDHINSSSWVYNSAAANVNTLTNNVLYEARVGAVNDWYAAPPLLRFYIRKTTDDTVFAKDDFFYIDIPPGTVADNDSGSNTIAAVPAEAAATVTSLAAVGDLVTATQTAHGYWSDELITIANAEQEEYNGTYQITRLTADTFQYTYTTPETVVTPATTLTALTSQRSELNIRGGGAVFRVMGSVSGIKPVALENHLYTNSLITFLIGSGDFRFAAGDGFVIQSISDAASAASYAETNTGNGTLTGGVLVNYGGLVGAAASVDYEYKFTKNVGNYFTGYKWDGASWVEFDANIPIGTAYYPPAGIAQPTPRRFFITLRTGTTPFAYGDSIEVTFNTAGLTKTTVGKTVFNVYIGDTLVGQARSGVPYEDASISFTIFEGATAFSLYKDETDVFLSSAGSTAVTGVTVDATTTLAAQAWSRSATTATLTYVGHTLVAGDYLYVTVTSDVTSVTLGVKEILTVSGDDVTFTCLAGGASGTATVTQVVNHGFVVSESILVSVTGATDTAYDGEYTATATDNHSFTYTAGSTPASTLDLTATVARVSPDVFSSSTDTGTTTENAQNSVVVLTFSDVPPVLEYTGLAGGKRRVYRSNTGSEATEFQYLTEAKIPAYNELRADWAEVTINDTYTSQELQEILPSATWVAPPDDDTDLYEEPMQKVVALSNGLLCGFSGKTICFNEPGLPHAWPVAYRTEVKNAIIDIAPIHDGVLVLTTEAPVLVLCQHPSTLGQVPLDGKFACVSASSAVDMGGVVFYASKEGIVGVDATGAKLLTGHLMDEWDWQEMFFPSTVKAFNHEGRYVGCYTDGETRSSFIFDPRGQEASLVTCTQVWEASFTDTGTDNSVFIVEGGVLAEWEQGEFLDYVWHSGITVAPKTFSPSVIRQQSDGTVEIQLYADGALRANMELMDNASRRVPGGYRGKELSIQLTGTASIEQIGIWDSMRDVL